MSDTFDAAAHVAAAETAAAPAPEETRVAQAEVTAPSDQTAEAPDTSEEPTPADPTDAPETPSRGDKRVQQLLAERHALREQVAYLQGAAQRGQQPGAPPSPQQAGPPPLAGDLAQWVGEEPKPDAFPAGEFDPQYLRAIARFEARSEQAGMIQMQRVQAQRQTEAARAQAFIEQAAKAEKDRPDFREVAGRLGSSLPNWAANLIAEAGTEVVYAVGKDAEAEARIRAARSPLAVAREIGRIEARLERAKETPPPQPTSAPDPAPRAVRGGNAGARAPADMPMAEYASWRAKQTWD
jgi:hypothetical protein